MKKTILAIALLLGSTALFSQERDLSDISANNSWLKFGLNASVPVGDFGPTHGFALGFDLRGQFLTRPYLGVGIATGYTNYFGKDNIKDFGMVPLGLMVRYYQAPQGFFIGTDAGYSFLTNSTSDNTGGLYLRPQIGYHNYNWNIFGFYNHVFRGDYVDVADLGIGVHYNIRFNK